MTAAQYRAARRALDLTQAQLAELVNRHPSIISKRERGEKPITREAELSVRYLSLLRGDEVTP